MKLLIFAIAISLSACAYNSPGAKVDNRIAVNASFMPPTEQILTTNAR